MTAITNTPAFVDYPSISHANAIMSNFDNVYLFFKEAQYFESIYRLACGSTAIGDSLKSKLSDATGICQLNFLVNKAFSTYNIASDFVQDPSNVDRQKMLQSSLSLISVAIKVVQFAQKAFAVAALKTYGTGLNIARDCADIGDKSIAIMKSWSRIRSLNTKLADADKRLNNDSYISAEKNKVPLLKLERDALQAVLNFEWAGIAQTTSILSLAALDLVAQVYMQITGADKVLLVATTVITLTAHVMSYEASLASQIRAPIKSLAADHARAIVA